MRLDYPGEAQYRKIPLKLRLSLHKTQLQRHFKQVISLYAFKFSAAFASAASFSNAAASENGLTRERPSAPNPGRVPEPPPARPAASSRLSRHSSRAETQPGRGASPTRGRSPPGRGGRGEERSRRLSALPVSIFPPRPCPPAAPARPPQGRACALPPTAGGLLCVRRLAEGSERLRCLSKEFESFPLTPSEGLSAWRVLQSACVDKRGALLASCFPYVRGPLAGPQERSEILRMLR